MSAGEKKVRGLDPTLFITFQAKWLPGLTDFLSPSFWGSGLMGIQFQPTGEHGATIVAHDGAAMVVIQDPRTVMTYSGPAPKVWDISFRPEFIAKCTDDEFDLVSSEGDAIAVPRPDWQRAEWVSVLGLGMGERDYRMRDHIAYIKAFADPPGHNDLLLEKDKCWVNEGHGRVKWEIIDSKSREPYPAPDPWRVASGYLAKLGMFGHSTMASFGRDGLSRWTFADAPEVTVYIMPWMPRASELDQEAAG